MMEKENISNPKNPASQVGTPGVAAASYWRLGRKVVKIWSNAVQAE
jgi:hypothetical protein